MSPRCTKSLFSCMSGVAESKNPRSHKELLGFVLFRSPHFCFVVGAAFILPVFLGHLVVDNLAREHLHGLLAGAGQVVEPS